MEVSHEELLGIIGAHHVELLLLRQKLAKAEHSLAEAVGEVNRLRAQQAAAPAEKDPDVA